MAKRADLVITHVAHYVGALRRIVALAQEFDGDTDEREQDDLEDAFNNGIDVGRHDALNECAALARAALSGTLPTKETNR